MIWIHDIHASGKKCFWFNSIFFPVYEIQKKIMIKNCLLHVDLQIWLSTFFYKMYIHWEMNLFVGIFVSKTIVNRLKWNFKTILYMYWGIRRKIYLNLRYKIASWHLVTWTCVFSEEGIGVQHSSLRTPPRSKKKFVVNLH